MGLVLLFPSSQQERLRSPSRVHPPSHVGSPVGWEILAEAWETRRLRSVLQRVRALEDKKPTSCTKEPQDDPETLET